MSRWPLLALMVCLGACESSDTSVDQTDPDAAADGAMTLVDAEAVDADLADADTPDAEAPDAEPVDMAQPDAETPDAVLEDGGIDAMVDPCDPDGNDRAGSATVFGLEADRDGQICADDEDWYTFTLPPGVEGALLIGFSHDVGDLDAALYADGDFDNPVAVSESATDLERFTLSAVDAPRVFHLHIYGYRDAEGPYTLSAPLFALADAEPLQIDGTVQYEDRPFDPSGLLDPVPAPARGMVVQLVRSIDGVVALETLTDESGAFSLSGSVQMAAKHWVQVLAVSRYEGFEVVVRDRTNAQAIYALSTQQAQPETFAEGLQLLAPVDESIAGALNIADVVWRAFEFITPYVDAPSPTLTFNWQRGQAFGCGSCYSRNVVSLGGQLEDPDEYDDDIILHEFGHYFVAHFSHDDSPGGPHRNRQVTPTLAYGEGLAYFFAAMVRGVPDSIDTFLGSTRHIDLEAVTQQGVAEDTFFDTTTGTVSGDHREEIIAGIMWDALDPFSGDEPFDLIEIGEAGHMAIFVDVFGNDRPADEGAQGTDLADWLNVLACEVPVADVQALADDREYPWRVTEDGGACSAEKGRTRAPFVLKAGADGQLWALPRAGTTGIGPTHVLWGKQAGSLQHVVASCSKTPCVLGEVTPDDVVVLTGRHEGHFVGTSWVGHRAAEKLLGGKLVKTPAGPVRLYQRTGAF
ncbi:MAG: hypothetical protein ACE366_30825 [Bradymonadia bacterium]